MQFQRKWERAGLFYVPRYERVQHRNPHRSRTIPQPEALISFIASASAGAVGTPNATTTGNINATGANFAVGVCVWDAGAADPTVTDSTGSNTYTKLTVKSTTNHKTALFYSANITTSAALNFTTSTTSGFQSLAFAVFSGVKTASPFDQQNGATATTGQSLQTGSVTPSENNELLAAGLGLGTIVSDPTGVGINLSFATPVSVAFSAGNHYAVSLSWLIQTTAAAANPTWSWTNSAQNTAEIATFKVTPGAGRISRVSDLNGLGGAGQQAFNPPLN